MGSKSMISKLDSDEKQLLAPTSLATVHKLATTFSKQLMLSMSCHNPGICHQPYVLLC